MTRTTLKAALLALGTLAAAVPAMAQQLVDGSRPDQILAVAKGYGTAELGKDDTGDPKITGRMDGTRYSVLFYDCKEGKRCRSIQLWAGFALENKPTMSQINAFNARFRFGKVHLDNDGDPIVELDVNLEGGVSRKNLDDTFEWFKVVIRRVREAFVGES